jgi:hypothetical protein
MFLSPQQQYSQYYSGLIVMGSLWVLEQFVCITRLEVLEQFVLFGRCRPFNKNKPQSYESLTLILTLTLTLTLTL